MKTFKITLSPSVIYYLGVKKVTSNTLNLNENEILHFFSNLKVSKVNINQLEEQKKINKIYNSLKGKHHKIKVLRDGIIRNSNVLSLIKIKEVSFKDISIKEI